MEQTRAAARWSAKRSVAPWIVIAVAAIVLGLLGMHVLRDVEPAHGAATSASVAAAATAPESPGASVAAAVATAGTAENRGLTGQERVLSAPADGHDTVAPIGGCLDLVSVCVLALILTFAFVVRRARGRTSTLSRRAFVVLRARAPGRLFGDPPSLLALSVLRT